jgi:WD40 repeat protein
MVPLVTLEYEINDLVIGSDEMWFAVAGSDDVVHILDSQTGEEIAVWRTGHGAIHDLMLSPDGTELAAATESGLVVVWELE